MTLTKFHCLGLLTLEGGPAAGEEPLWSAGSLLNPVTFNFPIISERVSGSWAEFVFRGDRALESPCIEAAKRLVERGAKAITADCGFLIRYQAAIAAAVDIPVAMSSLLLIPTLLRQLQPAAKLAIITANAAHCDFDLLGINDPADRERVVIGGGIGNKLMERLKTFHPHSPTEPTENKADKAAEVEIASCVADLEIDIAACIAQLRAEHPDIAAILFECTLFPVVTSAIRRAVKLPVYDITTLVRMTFESLS
ncbi:hypothetical protein NKH63_26060 [Mesorhizobium sp. M0960]|uniref:hypothetical protein n=1 Tax=Mesorhizobium sp. M0960 TaxID=2957035 RepID=UPI00333D294D